MNTFLKCSHVSTLSIWTEEIQAKSVEWNTQTAINCDTFWLHSFGTCNRQIQKLYVIWGQLPSTSPWGLTFRGDDLTEGFLRYEFGGLIFGGAYTWRSLFSEFYGILPFALFQFIHSACPHHSFARCCNKIFRRIITSLYNNNELIT